jgi:hypothetical protein
VLALALCWRAPRWRHLAPALVAAGSLWIVLLAPRPIELLREREPSFPPKVAALLQELVPPGEQVVTCEWHVTGEMMLALPERRFMVALDPVFMAMQDEAQYRLWFETIHRPPANAGAVLREAFDARFVICDRRMRWLPLVEALDADEVAELRGVVGLWVVYELLPLEAGEAEATPPLALH